MSELLINYLLLVDVVFVTSPEVKWIENNKKIQFIIMLYI